MPRKLNDSIIRSLALPDRGQRVVWDGGLPRFGLRLAAGGSRSWVVKYKVRGRSRWLTLGTYPLVPLTDARSKAKEALAAVVQGADPVGERSAEREAPTFENLAKEYIERHAQPKKRSWKADERAAQALAGMRAPRPRSRRPTSRGSPWRGRRWPRWASGNP